MGHAIELGFLFLTLLSSVTGQSHLINDFSVALDLSRSDLLDNTLGGDLFGLGDSLLVDTPIGDLPLGVDLLSNSGLSVLAADSLLDGNIFLDPITGHPQSLDISANDLLGGVPNDLRLDAAIVPASAALSSLSVPELTRFETGPRPSLSSSATLSGPIQTVEINSLPSHVLRSFGSRRAFTSKSQPIGGGTSKMAIRVLPKSISNNILMVAKRRQMLPLVSKKRYFQPIVNKFSKPHRLSSGYPKSGSLRVMPKKTAMKYARKRLSISPLPSFVQMRLRRPIFSSRKGRY